MKDNDRRGEIVRLEAQIDELAARIESCRKFIVAGRIAVVGGGVVLIATVVGAIQFDPSIMAVAVAAVPAGIVAVGANRSTAIEATHELTAAVIGLEACTTAHYLAVLGPWLTIVWN